MGEEKRTQAAAEKFICMERHAGLGVVLMALGAAKALKAASECSIIMITAPEFRSLVESCPHIDHVVDDISSARNQYGNVEHVDLESIIYGFSRLHQIDAYLETFGITAESSMKNIDLIIGQSADDEVEQMQKSWPVRPPGCARILIHPAQADRNRTWPIERWSELASKLIALGHQVIAMGSTTGIAGHGIQSLAVEGLLSTVDSLSLLGAVSFVHAGRFAKGL